MAITLYGLKSCDTCKKALAALEAAGKAARFVDIRAEADLAEKVPQWLAALGAEAVVNKRSTTWRSLSEAEKAAAESGDAQALLIATPTLIKRPVIEADGETTIGWGKSVEARFR